MTKNNNKGLLANMDVIPNVFVNEKYIGDYTSLLTYLKEKRYGSKE